MQADPNKIVATYDPLANGVLIGSGPWECKSSTGVVGAGCSSTGFMNPGAGGSYTLQRFGKGLAPASSTTGIYFRSAGNLALWIWSEQNNVSPELIFSIVASCYGQPALPLGGVPAPSSCAHFQQGIGASGGPTVVGLNQVSIELRFYGLDWVAPYSWASAPPTGIGPLSPVLYEGITLNPASVAGCNSAYPTGGYDC